MKKWNLINIEHEYIEEDTVKGFKTLNKLKEYILKELKDEDDYIHYIIVRKFLFFKKVFSFLVLDKERIILSKELRDGSFKTVKVF